MGRMDRLDLGKVGKGSGQDLQGLGLSLGHLRPQALGTLIGLMGPGLSPQGRLAGMGTLTPVHVVNGFRLQRTAHTCVSLSPCLRVLSCTSHLPAMPCSRWQSQRPFEF
jgi:hypothetical protein